MTRFARPFILSALLMLGACANEIAPPQAGAAPAAYVYHLGPDDKVRIAVYGEDPLAGETAEELLESGRRDHARGRAQCP